MDLDVMLCWTLHAHLIEVVIYLSKFSRVACSATQSQTVHTPTLVQRLRVVMVSQTWLASTSFSYHDTLCGPTPASRLRCHSRRSEPQGQITGSQFWTRRITVNNKAEKQTLQEQENSYAPRLRTLVTFSHSITNADERWFGIYSITDTTTEEAK